MTVPRERLFGSDLRLSDRAPGLDFVPSLRHDLDLAVGNDNIVQALILRLRIRQGELAPLGWPNYGSRLHELIGEANSPRTHARLMAYARAAIEADPRVLEIEAIAATVLPGERQVVRLQMEIQLIEQPHPLNLVHDIDLEAS
ncbi:hypothetical protein XM38_032820 [Halomicronema hongdechloris C2206]|uniref:IraD/Gp25-like domain-containing protein n=1 Tax=Halomicronema hongdechloris C2206 TaxID=1641165 RepID=A0A1Z3HPV5_9CYAN|nr:hypothetical protein [Halomicronema hongdechloris]ASC72325.1 hypothetical protein XM38_032820 [Halomicronema hongdechloris C2206]